MWARRASRRRLSSAVSTVLIALVLPAAAIAAPGTITTVAGSGVGGFSGDGGPATAAALFGPESVSATPDGGFLIADTNNRRIRRVSAAGIITTVAGDGTNGFGGDGGPATAAQISSPWDVAATPDGGFLIADTTNLRVRRVSPSGVISTVAGNGNFGTPADGAPAAASPFGLVAGVAPTDDGGFLIVDDSNSSVFKVSAGGIITRVAGNNTLGFSGDGGPATAAQLHFPRDVSVTDGGGFLIADGFVNSRIREVDADGTIRTVAGSGAPFSGGFSGDGDPATDAQLSGPRGVAAADDGGFLIADTGNGRIRKVSAGGVISTVAGSNFGGFGGDGDPATEASLNGPFSVSPTRAGAFLIADAGNNRIRHVEGDAPVLGKTVNAQVVKGKVLVRPARGGRKFVPLGGSRQVPVGSVLDTRNGTVGLTSAVNAKGATQQGRFTAGVFRVEQSRLSRARGLTELQLQGSSFQRCGTAGHGNAVRPASHSRRKVRSLRATARGRFRTRGRFAVATAGAAAAWQTTDRCDGTLVKVTRGKVTVRDLARNDTVIVRAGKSYVAQSRK